MALDRFGRRISYLRISLTDHCNLRCLYCLPEDITFRPSAELMRDEEILLFARLFAEMGFSKFRLTGGEPTLRQNIVELVRGIADIPGVQALSMTTNGMLLSRLAKPLANAGLQRINVSIDTLNPVKFQRLTRWGKLEDVWEGIILAEQAGLKPIKLNTVVVKGHNEDDVVDLARLTMDRPWQLRFIEMMPFSGATEFQTSQMVSVFQIQHQIEQALGSLEPLNGGRLDGEARLYRIPGAKGQIGFIATISAPFCASCTRARLTADGILRMCLLREHETDLLTPLRSGASPETLRKMILAAVWSKPWGHGLSGGNFAMNRTMGEIGG